MKVAVLSPGDMGAGVGAVLKQTGVDVLTCLAGRSELTRLRAQESGIRDVPSLDDLVQEADLLLSVLVPSEAYALAERVAESVKRTSAHLTYVDLNAVSPSTARNIGGILEEDGAGFIDGGIIGGPPRAPGVGATFVCSGPDTSAFEALGQHGLNVKVVGPDIGQASGLKMLYASSTKGTTALWTELLIAARALGLHEQLMEYIQGSRVAEDVMRGIPGMPRRARRWVGEMEEIASTYAEVGLTPSIFLGAADIYRFIGDSKFGSLTERDPQPDLGDLLDGLAQKLDLLQ